METLLIVLCAVGFLLALVVASPVVIAIDSRKRRVSVRWLYVMEFQMPLPWTPGRKSLKLFHRAVPLRDQCAARPPAGTTGKSAKPAAGKSKARETRRARGRFFVRCLGNTAIRRTLAQQLAKFIRRASQAVRVTGSASVISLSDPALNGMLAGALAASNRGRQAIRVNFTGQNSAFLELRFHPHRVLQAFLLSLPGLPYQAMFRQWQADRLQCESHKRVFQPNRAMHLTKHEGGNRESSTRHSQEPGGRTERPGKE